jgi:hypothetical protein
LNPAAPDEILVAHPRPLQRPAQTEEGAMARVSVKESLGFPAQKVWELVSDFGNVSWIQGLGKSEVQGRGPGMVRILHAGDGPAIHERLESLDAARRTLTYTIPENIPFPVSDYRATMTVREAGPGASELEWSCELTPKGIPDAQAVAMMEGMYKTMIGWLREALA